VAEVAVATVVPQEVVLLVKDTTVVLIEMVMLQIIWAPVAVVLAVLAAM
jgi:hypothetical protein